MEKLTNKAKELVAPVAGTTDDRLQKVASFGHQVTGVTVSTEALRKASQYPSAAKPEKYADTEPTDGLWIDDQNRIDLSAIQNDGIKILGAEGRVTPLLQDSRLRWPDTFSQGPDGTMYITASHIQDFPWFHQGWTDDSFTLFKFVPPK